MNIDKFYAIIKFRDDNSIVYLKTISPEDSGMGWSEDPQFAILFQTYPVAYDHILKFFLGKNDFEHISIKSFKLKLEIA